MSLKTPSAPHIHARTSVSVLMLSVVLALIPAMIAHVWFFGWGLPIQMFIAIVTALCCEALILYWRRKPIWPSLADGSALVTAVLLAFSIPPITPWWMVMLGTAFAIVVAKHLYGGLGYNPFNPAMIGYVVLLISFPLEMTMWLAPHKLNELGMDFTATLKFIFLDQLPQGLNLDSLTMATPLDKIKTELGHHLSINEIIMQNSSALGFAGSRAWQWINLWILFGGLFLIFKKVIRWHIPVSLLMTLVILSLVFHLIHPTSYTSPLFQLFSGATMLGAFFIATDPVTASTTNKGRLIYGASIGALTYIIRTWGGYPDGIAFAVLVMNMAAPTIDYYTRPKVFGYDRDA